MYPRFPKFNVCDVFGRGAPGALRSRRTRAFTLVEVLIVVVVLGIAGAMVIPSMSQTGVLRVQASVRTLVADIAYLQGEAMAFQARRAIWFGKVPQWDGAGSQWTFVDGNGYTMAEVTGPTLNLSTNAMMDPDHPDRPMGRNFNDARFGGAVISSPSFNGGALVIFDELGGTVADLDGPDPGAGGSVMVAGSGATFRVDVQAYTGKVTVTKTQDINH